MWQPHQGEEILRTESQPRLNIAKPESEQFAMTRQWHDQRLGRGHGEKALHESLELLGVIDEQRVCGILHHLNPRIRKLIDREHASLFAEGFDLMRLDRSGEPPARNEHQRRPNRRNASLHHVGGSHPAEINHPRVWGGVGGAGAQRQHGRDHARCHVYQRCMVAALLD
jgi:hypothetical protein